MKPEEMSGVAKRMHLEEQDKADEVADTLDVETWILTRKIAQRKGIKDRQHREWAASNLHPHIDRLGKNRFREVVSQAAVDIWAWTESAYPLSALAKRVREAHPMGSGPGQKWELEPGFLENFDKGGGE